MIWINISNISKVNNFTGIARTEFEICSYGLKLQQQGHDVKFSTFDVCIGFVEVDHKEISSILNKFRSKSIQNKKGLKFVEKFKYKLVRSICKRLRVLKQNFGKISHPYQQGDKVISVGQDFYSGEIKVYHLLKQKIKINFNLLCHDIIPITHPEFLPEQHSALFKIYFSEVIDVVDKFYCNSHFTKQELVKYLKEEQKSIPPIHVITLGCDLYKKETIRHSEFIDQLVKDKYLLFVSTIEIRKNHKVLYEAYLSLIEQGITNLPKIYFVGRRGWKVENLLKNLDSDHRIHNKIIILDHVSDGDLIQLYKKCWFTLYPSFIEGYGLPVAESLSFGKYCLSSNTGSLPEVGGNYIDYLNPHNINEWCEKILFLINHPSYITEKEFNIQNNYRPMTWEKTAKQILDAEL
ncbi:glycosyltransferase family 4 protein [Acinetobacter puyangensis]|uniref:Glycosyltransferase involved in cell wall bisynthesis n=1 Tax=Acinetobacter puyangensis TaxID=1096779 RepID=A0A240E3E5_9GAMM|nr:glycosyltransferase family 1 protein [Acinetobacter puyangensis]SNX43294.1 Glycosyltransferase involved in cell wall bisynthesis [Acinetobacter puyangensis]